MPHHPTPDRRRRSDPPPPGEGGRTAKQSAPSPAALLAWFDRHRRVLPWRAAPGEDADPYRVWLSEIMLQQTTVKAVGPYYLRFVAQFPSVAKLAEADIEDVLRLWAGLGYYARAPRRMRRIPGVWPPRAGVVLLAAGSVC